MHGEGRFGQGQSNFGFQRWPANTGAVLPLGGESFAASSLCFAQTLSKRSVLMVGKINAVDLLVDFNEEQGLEAWYSLALTPWFKLTADAQIINPARGDADTAVITGLRGNLAF